MRLSLSEIRANAMRFAAEWTDAASERADAQTFWGELFSVFGIKRRSVASFEEKVRNLGGKYDRIDVFYSGVMLGEHKSSGEDLSKAASQAFDYVQSLTREGRHNEVPQFIVVSDFVRIVVYDLETKNPADPVATFKTAKLHENIKHLGFLSGYISKPVDPEDPINTEAVEILGDLHDALEKGDYAGHKLERFLVRVLFCLFADDTGIFDPDSFKTMVEYTHADGRDLGTMLARLFDVLNTPKASRPRSLPDELKDLPYVNGELFSESLGFADFSPSMRDALLGCCKLNWSKISPAVFGSLFQSIMAGESGVKKRRQIGAHYTSERDIMKLVRSLFLDELRAELAACGRDKNKLIRFQDKLASLRFLDPACGCGNFLVITYRELRLLELEAVWALHGSERFQERLNLDAWLKVDVDQMHGIEIEEWPARIAEVAMWLIDHQMNQAVGEAFGTPLLRLPLRKTAKIHVGNALRTNWNSVLSAQRCSFVLGNPPFVGKKEQNSAQKADMERVWGDMKGAGVLDYVTCWYRVASQYIKGTQIAAAFVSTNSICQGEQVGALWNAIYAQGVRIRFAHRTFAWASEARGKAHVHVVIVGFGYGVAASKRLYEYGTTAEPTVSVVANISPYLVPGPDVALTRADRPVSSIAPEMTKGSEVTDDGHLLMNEKMRTEIARVCPGTGVFLRRFMGGDEFINGDLRYCLWLRDASPSEFRKCQPIRIMLEAVKAFRLRSRKLRTVELAATPYLFGEDRQPSTRYLLIPKVSSEKRTYIPIGFMPPSVIVSGSALIVPGATRFHLGILSSIMHMAWMRQVCGRMKSDYQYSVNIVYNNFPWPTEASDTQKTAVESAAQCVLDARDAHKGKTLADLYDPLAMPKDLRNAHKDLDRAVDKCYRAAPFASERARVEYLFDLYQRLTTPLTAPAKRPSRHQA